MSAELTASCRDALRRDALDRLAEIDTLWRVIAAEDHESAARLGWEYCDCLRLILEGLGWGHEPEGGVDRSPPADVLHRALARLQGRALGEREEPRPIRGPLTQPATPITITAAHRDALYQLILYRLTGVGDVWQAVADEDYQSATRLGWEYSDYLRLILEDLGWGYGPPEPIRLTVPRDVLRRAFTRLGQVVDGLRPSEADEWADLRERSDRSRLVAEACDTVLGELE